MNLGIFESLAADQSDARLASRRALVLSRDRIDIRLGKFLGASRSPQEFDARYDLVSEDFVGIVRVAANEVGHDDPDVLVETLRDHYAKDWIQKAVKKPGDLHRVTDTPEDENIPESKVEDVKEHGDKNEKEKAQFAENVKGLGKGKKSTVADYLSAYYSSDDDDDDEVDYSKDDEREELLRKKEEKEEKKEAKRAKKKAKKDKKKDRKPLWLEDAEEDAEDEDDEHSHDDDDGAERESSMRTADEKGNTGLSGPSPKMDKQRWTPKSVSHDEYDGGKHETGDHVEDDVTKPDRPENLTGPAKDTDGIGSAKEVSLPAASNYDDAGFATGGEDSGPHTKTWGSDSREADPVGSAFLGS